MKTNIEKFIGFYWKYKEKNISQYIAIQWKNIAIYRNTFFLYRDTPNFDCILSYWEIILYAISSIIKMQFYEKRLIFDSLI